MDALEFFGHSISMDKPVILLRLVGKAARAQLKRHTAWQNGSKWVAIRRQSGQVLLGSSSFTLTYTWGFAFHSEHLRNTP